MRAIIISICFFLFSANLVYAGCPLGSYEWRDEWGNKICKSYETDETRSIEGSTQKCPLGTHLWVDEWGNKICKSYQNNNQYYDTSGGCPLGTYEWVDNWGNRVCKKY